MIRSTDITSTSELRQHLRAHLERLKASGRPLYVTTNGETDAVVLSPGTFDDLLAKAELMDSLSTIDRSMEDYRAGNARPLHEAMQGIARELDLMRDA